MLKSPVLTAVLALALVGLIVFETYDIKNHLTTLHELVQTKSKPKPKPKKEEPVNLENQCE